MAQAASDEAWRLITVERDSKFHLRVSRLLSCLRQQHYRANMTPPTNEIPPDLKIDAHQGTATHGLYLPYYAQAWPMFDKSIAGCDDEYPMSLTRDGFTLTGHCDVVAWRRDDTAMIWDLKTLSTTKFDGAAAGYGQDHAWTQVRAYAYILEKTTGKRVTDTLLYNVDRSDPEAFKDYKRSRRRFTACEPFTDTHRQQAKTLIDSVFGAATSIQAAPRWFGAEPGKINGPYSPCRKCPWQTRCLGKPVRSEDPTDIAHGDAAAEVIRGWNSAKSLESAASKAIRTHIKLVRQELDPAAKAAGKLKELVEDLGLELEEYSDGQARYRLYEDGGGEMKDADAMAKILTELGRPIPMKTRARSLKIEVLPL